MSSLFIFSQAALTSTDGTKLIEMHIIRSLYTQSLQVAKHLRLVAETWHNDRIGGRSIAERSPAVAFNRQ